jgi:hypothetical protein
MADDGNYDRNEDCPDAKVGCGRRYGRRRYMSSREDNRRIYF